MERPTLTTVYADGRTESRSMTDDEFAEHEATRKATQELEAQILEQRDETQRARESALAKLQSLGLTAKEAAAIVGLGEGV